MSNKLNEMWTPILNDFERNYVELIDKVIDWYPSNRNEIVVTLDDNRRLVYDWLSKKCYEIVNINNSKFEDENTWKNNFARRLTLKIRNTCYTQERLANETGISIVTINKYATGKAIPNACNLEKIASALNCSIYELTSAPIY